MKIANPKLAVCLVVLLLAFAIGGFSFYQLSHIFPRQITYLALGSAFLLSDITKLRGWGGSFAIIYVLFHTLLVCATAVSMFLLASRHLEAKHQQLSLTLAFLLSAPLVWFMSYYWVYWLLFAWVTWGLLAVAALWKWSSAARKLRMITLACTAALGGVYLVMLLLWPTVPPNQMP
jgi:hypothetical protein